MGGGGGWVNETLKRGEEQLASLSIKGSETLLSA